MYWRAVGSRHGLWVLKFLENAGDWLFFYSYSPPVTINWFFFFSAHCANSFSRLYLLPTPCPLKDSRTVGAGWATRGVRVFLHPQILFLGSEPQNLHPGWTPVCSQQGAGAREHQGLPQPLCPPCCPWGELSLGCVSPIQDQPQICRCDTGFRPCVTLQRLAFSSFF